jgi:hypothetical protein
MMPAVIPKAGHWLLPLNGALTAAVFDAAVGPTINAPVTAIARWPGATIILRQGAGRAESRRPRLVK